MNYNKIYNQLIKRADSENRVKCAETYYEKHHILPRSLGGSDNDDNLILLTPREHFIAHWLLYKMHSGSYKHRMGHAWFCMSRSSNNQIRYNSRHYKYIREAHAKSASYFHTNRKLSDEEMKARKGANNPNARRVTINGMTFGTISECAKYFKTSTRNIRKYLNDKLEYRYLVDIQYRKEVRNNNISKSNYGQNKGKTYEEMYGEDKAKKLKEIRRKHRQGYSHSEETKLKISESKIGKPSWAKGITFSVEHKNNISKSRAGDSRSKKNYKIIDPEKNEYIVTKGLRWFWREELNKKFPICFKKVTDYAEGIGEWKGWKIYVLP